MSNSLNSLQIKIFQTLSKEKEMDVDAYIQQFSTQYLCKEVTAFADLTEEEGDAWITKAYLDSLL